MKKMIAILMILIPLAALSQAKKSDAFYYKGFELINAKKYKEAISHYEKCSLLDKEDYDISEGANYYRSEEKIIECYEALAEEYFAKYNFDKALRYSRLKLNLTKKIFGGNDPVFAQNLEELATINSDYGNNSEAVELQSEAVKIYKKLYGDHSEDYARALGSLVYYNYQIGNYIEALKLEKIAIKIRQELFGDDSPEFANSADNLANYQILEICDSSATEGNFKNLSGSGINILHIATHGFYRSNSFFGSSDFGFHNQNSEDISLSHSGLLMAGANYALNPDNEITDGFDDGILTAKEISRLDFSGLDLVILSACETALGDLGDDGVFGLQRGFKKAGAQTIIMSLWEVDDYATQLLMVEFFKKLGSGLSKRDAFNAAQEYVKSKTSDPKYWAAFIIVDAL